MNNHDKGQSPKGDKSNEQVIWNTYEKECEERGKTPSVEDFKEWTKRLLKSL